MAQVSHASHVSQPSLPHHHLVIPEMEALPTKNATWAQGQASWLSMAGLPWLTCSLRENTKKHFYIQEAHFHSMCENRYLGYYKMKFFLFGLISSADWEETVNIITGFLSPNVKSCCFLMITYWLKHFPLFIMSLRASILF